MPKYVETAVAAPVRGTFHYAVPEPLEDKIVPGAALDVWFGRRRATAYALTRPSAALPPDVPPGKIRPVVGLRDEAGWLSEPLLELARWISRRYFAPLGETIRAMVPAPVRRGAGRRKEAFVRLNVPRTGLTETITGVVARSPKQAAILEELSEAVDDVLPRSLLLREVGASASSLKSLERKGLVRVEWRDPEEETPPSVVDVKPPPVLSDEQETALAVIRDALGKSERVLLFGITGSGKTELYLRAIEDVVKAGRQAIVLVPEISLTPQTVERFRARFDRVAVLHSNLTEAMRSVYWRRIRSGKVDVVIGARSAVFAPVPSLGLIVVDEEHETSYKQDKAPRYHAVETALKRAEIERAAVVLGSATPSLESLHRAREGDVRLARLRSRPGGGGLPPVEVVDMRSETAGGKGFVLVSRRLRAAVEEALSSGGQVILFLNRRGFSTQVYCPVCGYLAACPHCDIPLTYHRGRGKLVCHYCGHLEPPPATCPVCGSERLLYLGTGTERVEGILEEMFPDARVARLDSDVARKRSAYFEVLGAFRSRAVDILVGTQMIAKGLDFPHVLLVGVINADVALNMADFRAAERTAQIISQVAGRAGRMRHGRVVVQTMNPLNPSIVAAARHDFEGFAVGELEKRRRWGYPPFTYLGRVVFSGKERKATESAAREVLEALQAGGGGGGFSFLGPAPCPYERLRGKYRFHLLIKAKTPDELEDLLERNARVLEGRRGADVMVDVNPFSLL